MELNIKVTTEIKVINTKTWGKLKQSCVLVARSCPTVCDPWIVACHAPQSMGFSRQEYRTGLPFPSPGDLPHPGIEPGFSCITGRFFTIWATREAPAAISKFCNQQNTQKVENLSFSDCWPSCHCTVMQNPRQHEGGKK